MSTQTLTDDRYHTIGYIDTAANGTQTGRNAHYHIVGYYDPHTNTTTDARYHKVGTGNLLAALISRC
jgi:hypothetical protein